MGQADGSFLVRPNSRRPGYYALTLIYNQMPYHYEIVSEVSSFLYHNTHVYMWVWDNTWVCGESWLATKDLQPTVPVLKDGAGHAGVLDSVYVGLSIYLSLDLSSVCVCESV